ncbi:hypothetical protein Tchar_01343 [Tepidimonas charontis]|uniref:Uncharacterized protein n=2 Tax=Tepidimonas charontis TaxID=2267262 RepID=A0A554XFB1_9BURK|nr:hypothetical protein Tchar_01343 [Tepidimonas charontis]
MADNARMAISRNVVLPPRGGAGSPSTWVAALLLSTLALGGCDQLGIDTPAKQAQRREAEGKAIGAGCRHTQRSLEDCYAANPKASKAAIFAGWREMDEYMRENDIAPLPRSQPTPTAAEEEVIESSPTASAPAIPNNPSAAPATGGGVTNPANGAPGAGATSPANRAAAPGAPNAAAANPAAAPARAPTAASPNAAPTGSIVPPLGPVTAPDNRR